MIVYEYIGILQELPFLITRSVPFRVIHWWFICLSDIGLGKVCWLWWWNVGLLWWDIRSLSHCRCLFGLVPFKDFLCLWGHGHFLFHTGSHWGITGSCICWIRLGPNSIIRSSLWFI